MDLNPALPETPEELTVPDASVTPAESFQQDLWGCHLGLNMRHLLKEALCLWGEAQSSSRSKKHLPAPCARALARPQTENRARATAPVTCTSRGREQGDCPARLLMSGLGCLSGLQNGWALSYQRRSWQDSLFSGFPRRALPGGFESAWS